jgi:16S rRNA (cytidine1402-2'-O)-methyltransferase
VAGELILVATPIGNLGDLSARAEEVLRSVDAIACEDTRHTMKLLSAKGITGKRLLAVHDHNEGVAARGIVALVERGERIALVTDAGTPAISDPGEKVVAAVIEAGLAVSAVPGPAAFVMALAISGLPTARFVFEGFLPPKGGARRAAILAVASEPRTIVLYEAPHRIRDLLDGLVAACGPHRRVAVARELTKRFEQVVRGPVGEVAAALAEPQGEFVVVIEGRPAVEADDPIEQRPQEITDEVARLRAAGMSLKDAAGIVAEQVGASRKHVYDLVVGTTNNPMSGQKITEP